jgi:hypothetical protein
MQANGKQKGVRISGELLYSQFSTVQTRKIDRQGRQENL